MNNNLIPEQRADVNGKLTVRWVKAFVQEKGRQFLAPAPTVTPGKEKPEQSRSLYEKFIDSIVNLLLGPEEKSSAADEEMRDLLRERLTKLPERTVKNLAESWEKAKTWADEGLDSTEFGMFSERVRAQVQELLEAEEMKNQTPEQTAERIDDYADRVRETVEKRTALVPPMPLHAPSNHLQPEEAPVVQATEYSPLNDFFEEIEQGGSKDYNSNIDDLMDNGRTRRHH